MKRADNTLAQDAATLEKQIGLVHSSQPLLQAPLGHVEDDNHPAPRQTASQVTLKQSNVRHKNQSKIAKNRHDKRTTTRVRKQKPRRVIESSSSGGEGDENDPEENEPTQLEIAPNVTVVEPKVHHKNHYAKRTTRRACKQKSKAVIESSSSEEEEDENDKDYVANTGL